MIVRLLHSSKWEMIVSFIITSLLAAVTGVLVYNVLFFVFILDKSTSIGAATAFFLLIIISSAYWLARKIQQRLDTLDVAMKQAINGDYGIRIGGVQQELSPYNELYQQFNQLVDKLESQVQWIQRQGERQVMSQLALKEMAVLEERKRLARDLHDTVSQQLFAIHMCASALPQLQKQDATRSGEVLSQLVEMSHTAQRQMRNFIAQLRPMELENHSLEEALDKWFPEYCRQNRLQGELDWRVASELTEAKEHQLFLIVQEAMANIVKHAKASKCHLIITENERQVILNLQDDGIGFRVDEVKKGSYGLSTMQERSQKLGGSTEIWSKPSGGTIVKVMIPKLVQGSEERGE